MNESNGILRLLFTEENVVVKATSGKRYIFDAENVFESYIDSDFKNWSLDKVSQITVDTPVNVYELIADAAFSKMFGSLSDDLDKLCLTQDQIIEFCLESRQRLRQDGCAAFFLFKENEHFFVAGVYVLSDGLFANVYRFEPDSIWDGSSQLRLVVPQL